MRRHRSRPRRVVAAATFATLVGLLGAACAGESPDPDATTGPEATDGTADPDAADAEVIPLPDGFQPEGVAAGSGTEVFVGSLRDGDIWRGDVDAGEGEVLADAPEGRVAVGLAVDLDGNRVFASGGPTGQAFVYDAATGEDLGAVTLPTAEEGTFVNDAVVTEDGAWFTDSRQPVLYLVPFEDDGSLGEVETLELQGPAADASAQFNLNGIDATADGSTIVVVHSSRGEIMTVDPETGESAVVDLGQESPVPNGDGILLEDSTLWVVQNFANQVAEVSLAEDLSSGEIASVLTSEEFRIPTTVARVGDRLVLVNARFDIEEPAPTDEYELVVLTP